jgi:orotate phosphoribosyltransferase-like protein
MKEDNVIKYSVLYLRSNGMDDKKIAKELGVSIKLVRKVPSDQKPKDPPPTPKISSKDLMINKTAAKGTKNISVMTKAASEINDSFRKKISGQETTRTTRNAIYKPFSK